VVQALSAAPSGDCHGGCDDCMVACLGRCELHGGGTAVSLLGGYVVAPWLCDSVTRTMSVGAKVCEG